MADLLCPVVVGRARELEVLRAALDAACAGTGSVVLIAGEAGIGKSRLAREAATAAAARGAMVLRGRAVPGASEVAFRPLTEALAAASDLVGDGDLASWAPALAAIVPGLGVTATGSTDTSGPARGEAIVRLLARLAPSGALLVLEDLQWSDGDTLAVLDHLTDHLDRAPVLCIATVRSDERTDARDLVRAVQTRRSAPVLELERLNDSQVAAMLHACTAGVDAAVVERVTANAEGVPFLVEELLTAPGVPTTFAETVERRMATLDADERLVLASAAVLGRDFAWSLLASATGLDEAVVAAALERGVGSQLLTVVGDGFRFRHALTREAILASVLPPRRRGLATTALAAIEQAHPALDGEWREIAARVAEAAGRDDLAARLLTDAGLAALAEGAFTSAIAALERADELDPAERIDVGLVDAYALAGRVDDALSRGRRVVDRLRPQAAAELRLRLARAAMAATRWDSAREQVYAARASAGALDDRATQASLAVVEAELAFGSDDGERASERALSALDAADAEGAPELACEALLILGRVQRQHSLEEAHATFARAAEVADRHDLAVWQLHARHELGTIAMLDRGDLGDLLKARALADRLGALSTVAVLDMQLSAGWSTICRLEEQDRCAAQSADLARRLGLGLIASRAEIFRAEVAARSGDEEAMAERWRAARATAPAGDETTLAMYRGVVEMMFALVREDRTAAMAALELSIGVLNEPGAPPAPARGLWPLILAVEGDRRAVDEIVAAERSGSTTNRLNRGFLTHARAVSIGADEPREAAALVAEGDSYLRHGPYWWQLSRRLVGEAALRDGWGDAVLWLGESEAWMRANGQPVIADACSALLRSPATVPSAWTRIGVTRREADVLELVVTGMSNKEIAARLHVSPRTVEKHVESMLRKTQTRSRTQLAAIAVSTAT